MLSTDIRIILFADSFVGQEIFKFIVSNFPNHLCLVVTTGDVEFEKKLVEYGYAHELIMKWDNSHDNIPKLLRVDADYFILAWWPYIVKKDLISLPKKGVLNFHPSFLPYNRGKNYNFWSLVEDTPFGVTIHFVDEGIDTGDIVFQKRIPKNWLDTGETLYNKAQQAIINLFIENYQNLVSDKFIRIPQDLSKGSFHFGNELEEKSLINLKNKSICKDLLNLLRARTFPPYPSCRFLHNGKTYYISIKITGTDREDLKGINEIYLTNFYSLYDLLQPQIVEKGQYIYFFTERTELYKVVFTVISE